MYSTCLFCHGPLGANEAVESFPVGRKLAFDSARGRLWVVCPACGRWNLTPLEERWEAVEEGEKLYRDASLRTQTEEIGLAQLREGLQLIRVGRPLRPEFAAWRYGDMLGQRRRRAIRRAAGLGAAASVGLGSAVALGAAAGLAALAPVLLIGVTHITTLFLAQQNLRRPVRVPTATGDRYTVFLEGLHESNLRAGPDAESLQLFLRHARGFVTLEGSDARRALGLILPKINPMGAGREQVRMAADEIARAGGPDAFLCNVAAESERRSVGFLEDRAAHRRGSLKWTLDTGARQSPGGGPANAGAPAFFAPEVRLALEMATHEEGERFALEGELARLEAEWRDAEEIAAIADRLLPAPGVEEKLDELKGKRDG